MCQPNAVMIRFKALLEGAAITEDDRLLFKEKSELLGETAVRRGRYELAIQLALIDEMVSSAHFMATRHETSLSTEEKVRVFHAFREVNDEMARMLQHRWKLTENLPARFRR